jgi:hypothetical protein
MIFGKVMWNTGTLNGIVYGSFHTTLAELYMKLCDRLGLGYAVD